MLFLLTLLHAHPTQPSFTYCVVLHARGENKHGETRLGCLWPVATNMLLFSEWPNLSCFTSSQAINRCVCKPESLGHLMSYLRACDLKINEPPMYDVAVSQRVFRFIFIGTPPRIENYIVGRGWGCYSLFPTVAWSFFPPCITAVSRLNTSTEEYNNIGLKL